MAIPENIVSLGKGFVMTIAIYLVVDEVVTSVGSVVNHFLDKTPRRKGLRHTVYRQRVSNCGHECTCN